MAAATPTEVTVKNVPATVQYGTSSRRCIVFLRCVAGSTSSTVNLATYVPGLADIEGILYETDANAKEATASTWSTTTVTISSGATGAYEGAFICTLT
jgi:hypothetical protein